VGWRASRAATKERARSRSEVKVRAWLTRLFAALGTVLGLGAITAAAWLGVGMPLGLLVAGLSFLILEWRLAE
jgi:hypothetical protein